MQKQVGIKRSSTKKISSLHCTWRSLRGKVSSSVQTPCSLHGKVSSLASNLSSSHVKVGGLKLSMWGYLGVWRWVGVVLLASMVGGSEFPERECCDPVYPPNTATTAAAPVTPPVSKSAGESFYILSEFCSTIGWSRTSNNTLSYFNLWTVLSVVLTN